MKIARSSVWLMACHASAGRPAPVSRRAGTSRRRAGSGGRRRAGDLRNGWAALAAGRRDEAIKAADDDLDAAAGGSSRRRSEDRSARAGESRCKRSMRTKPGWRGPADRGRVPAGAGRARHARADRARARTARSPCEPCRAGASGGPAGRRAAAGVWRRSGAAGRPSDHNDVMLALDGRCRRGTAAVIAQGRLRRCSRRRWRRRSAPAAPAACRHCARC